MILHLVLLEVLLKYLQVIHWFGIFFGFNFFFLKDTVKVRLQTQPTPKLGELPQFTGMMDCIRKTIKGEGF